MIDPDKRNAVYQMHLAGMSLREIARQMHLSRTTVRNIIDQQGVVPQTVRKDKIHIDADLLRRLYRECDGWAERVHQKLVEEEKIDVGYSTLTRLLREQGLGGPAAARCDHVPDEPGQEMQHDTSVYKLKLAGHGVKLIASLLYLRFCKRRYLKFYRVFNRFTMKCFFHETLLFWGHAARCCVIDNTNLARLRGTGSRAVIVPEMVTFAASYGFQFVCHAIGHANRKAGIERSFRSVETGFLPGRTFQSLEDLNRQAREWATQRMDQRPVGKTRLIPAQVFEHERSYLIELPSQLPAPYWTQERSTDAYGYIAFEGNYYWVPGTGRGAVKVLRYAEHVKIYRERSLLAEYPLAADGVKNARFSPAGQPAPRHLPKHRKHGSQIEEQRLRAMGPEVAAYVDYALQTAGIQRHRLLRELLALSRKVPAAAFVEALTRALRYRVLALDTLERIAWLCTSQTHEPLPEVDVDESFRDRPAYQEGCLTDTPDLSHYDETLPKDQPTDPSETQSKDGETQSKDGETQSEDGETESEDCDG
jgi:transposase